MIVDMTAAARTPDAARLTDWLSTQRAFISSALGDTADERRRAAEAVEAEGARPVWFEELGRDADAQEAYIAGVDSSTIYIGILNELYGRIDSTGFSATEKEFNRARERGHRVAVFVAADRPAREGHLRQFLERVRVFITTESYVDPDDLARRVQRRLRELAAEALSPWVMLDDLVFRADEIVDRGSEITINARTNDDIAYRLEALRDQMYGRQRVRFIYGDRVVDADVAGVERTVRFGGAADLTVSLTRATRVQQSGYGRISTSGLTPDDLTELGLRELFFGEVQAQDLRMMGLTRTGIEEEDLAQVFELPNEIVAAVTRLVIVGGLIGSGNAARLTDVQVGPRVGDSRTIRLRWEPPAQYGQAAASRELVGAWRAE